MVHARCSHSIPRRCRDALELTRSGEPVHVPLHRRRGRLDRRPRRVLHEPRRARARGAQLVACGFDLPCGDGLRVGAMRTFLRVLVAALTALISAAITCTTTASAAAFTYDGPSIARVDVHAVRDVEVRPAQLKGTPEVSTFPRVAVRGVSTTLDSARNATNTAVPGRVARIVEEDVLDSSHQTRGGSKSGGQAIVDSPARQLTTFLMLVPVVSG